MAPDPERLDLSTLRSKSWRERKRAIEALAASGSDQALAKALVDVIRNDHADLELFNSALQLLSTLKAPVLAGLIELLHDPDPDTRLYAALALGELRDPGAISPLLEVLSLPPTNDREMNVTFNVIEALGKLGAVQAVEPLMVLLEGEDFYLAFPILAALAAIGDPRPAPQLLKYLDDPLLSVPAARALGSVGGLEVFPALVAWLESGESDPLAAVGSLVALAQRSGNSSQETGQLGREIAARIGPRGTSQLIALASPAAGKEQPGSLGQDAPALARLLGWLLDVQTERQVDFSSTVAALLRLLEDRRAAPEAREALRRAGQAAEPFVVARLKGSDSSLRNELIHLVGELDGPDAAQALAAQMESDDEDGLVLTAQALGSLSDPSALPDLHALAAHASGRVRQAAVEALLAFEPPAPFNAASALAGSPDPLARESGLRMFSHLKELQVEGDLLIRVIRAGLRDNSAAVRRAALEVAVAFPGLICKVDVDACFRDEDQGVRTETARALAGCPPALALPWLHRALKDPAELTRWSACRSLGVHADSSSLPYLAELVHDPSPLVRIALAETLGRIGGSGSEALLRAMRSDSNADVVQTAARVLEFILPPQEH